MLQTPTQLLITLRRDIETATIAVFAGLILLVMGLALLGLKSVAGGIICLLISTLCLGIASLLLWGLSRSVSGHIPKPFRHLH